MKNNFLEIKDKINETLNKKYEKNANEKLMNLLLDLDDIKGDLTFDLIKVNINFILESTEIYDSIKPILYLSEKFVDVKELARKILTLIFIIIKKEVFYNYKSLKAKKSYKCEFTQEELSQMEHIYEECTVRTDNKYLSDVNILSGSSSDFFINILFCFSLSPVVL